MTEEEKITKEIHDIGVITTKYILDVFEGKKPIIPSMSELIPAPKYQKRYEDYMIDMYNHYGAEYVVVIDFKENLTNSFFKRFLVLPFFKKEEFELFLKEEKGLTKGYYFKNNSRIKILFDSFDFIPI